MPKNKTNLPATLELLNKVSTTLIDNKFNSINTLVTYTGSGIKSYIRFVIKHRNEFHISGEKAYIFFDLRQADTNAHTLYFNAASSLIELNEDILNKTTTSLVKSVINSEVITKGQFIGLMEYLHQDAGLTPMFVISGLAKLLTANNNGKEHLFDLIKNTNHFHGLFIQDFEVNDKLASKIQPIWDYMLSNRVNGKDFLFDEDQIETALKNYDVHVSSDEVNFLKKFCIGEPAIYKKILLNVDKYREQGLFKLTSLREIIEGIDQEWINSKFGHLTSTITKESIELLKTNGFDASTQHYLVSSGLVEVEKHKLRLRNKLLEWYITNAKNENKEDPTKFTGQEELLVNLLRSNTGEIVTRERLAQEIWGETWETNYTDWALDKVISNVRAKLQPQGISITSIKKRGVVLRNEN